ncbi:NUMOD1 domain-containing DNA-binding protein [Priestia megaterium]
MATKDNGNTVYDSIRYASELLNIKRPTIHHYLKTGKQHSTGYFFAYFD